MPAVMRCARSARGGRRARSPLYELAALRTGVYGELPVRTPNWECARVMAKGGYGLKGTLEAVEEPLQLAQQSVA